MFDLIYNQFADFGKGQAQLGWVANFQYARKIMPDFLERRINWHSFSILERALFESAFINAYVTEAHKWSGKGEGAYNPPLSESVILN